MRRLIEFSCAGETLLGTLDEGASSSGLLIVSGGNEIRCGAHRGMSLLAARLAADGTPVFRFDRRGIGDSSGANCGFQSAGPDIAAAAAIFSSETSISRLIAFGNCDAATALALFHQTAGIDALVLANPWVSDERDDLPPASAIRVHYAERLRDPGSWHRLLTGGVNLGKLFMGLKKISAIKSEHPDNLQKRLAVALMGSTPTKVVLARRDATAIAYIDAMRATELNLTAHIIDTDSHSFARAGDMDALEAILRPTLSG